MSKNFAYFIAIVVVSVGMSSLISFLIVRNVTPKIAYIRTNEVLLNYAGMKDARALIEDKRSRVQQSLDTLEASYNTTVADYNKSYLSLNSQAREDREKYIKAQQRDLYQYTQSVKEKHAEEERKITEGIVNQINSYVKQYSEEHKYSIVFGTTSEGSVMYGNEANDITKDVLEYLNSNYKK